MKNLMIKIFFLTGLQTILFGELPKELSSSQVMAWEKMEAFVEEIRDGRGMPVDEGIKKAIIVLNLLGYSTVQSCEGHLDHGLAYPWIAFLPEKDKIESISKLYEEKEILCNEADVIENELIEFNGSKSLFVIEEIQMKFEKKRQEIWNVWDQINEAKDNLFLPIWSLLEEFYREDSQLRLVTLILYEDRLIPIGGLCQKRFSKEKQKENLQAFGKELDQFAEFLIQKFRQSQS
ncbi:hypothetical protein [Simkania negevensis]|uniref:Uncharacterized protein n=1 Tax=Simkania negevensis (strain ATCC VR-1471 / DSM 27360 / Z) TaxID=331113 RepID=F8L5M6_SIMNZ|nr:hypothetical protein [Simkania negevensis]CCB89804.1 putative uncharacterized protein [Simkania negevensis Z]